MNMKCFILTCATLILCAEAANIPSYLGKCCATKSDAQNCFLPEANKAIPIIVKGDKQFNVIRLLPYIEAQRYLLDNHDGQFILNVPRLWGLDTVNVLSIIPDFNTGSSVVLYYAVKLKFQFTYIINIHHTPLHGFGRGEIILSDVNITHSIKFTPDKEGYAQVYDATVKYKAGNVAYKLENLCEEALEYFEDNYDQLNEMFQPGISRTLSGVMTSPMRSYAELIKLTSLVNFDCK